MEIKLKNSQDDLFLLRDEENFPTYDRMLKLRTKYYSMMDTYTWIEYSERMRHNNKLNYLAFRCYEDCSFKFRFSQDAITTVIYYSLDYGETWTQMNNNVATPTIENGSIVVFKGSFSNVSYGDQYEDCGIGNFSSTGKFSVMGDIKSIINFNDTLIYQNFFGLFFNNENIVSAKHLILPLNLSECCYGEMFRGCTSLTSAPELNATTLAGACYLDMFSGCTSLTSAPALPATTLAGSCYSHMFNGCTSLTSAPALNATTLANYCYNCMFIGCSNLNYIKALFTTTPSDSYTQNWVSGVASSGTFVKSPNASWDVTGNNGVPTGWEVVVEQPE